MTPEPRPRNRLATDLLTIGIDIGGTKIAAGTITAEGKVIDRTRRQTPGLSVTPSVVEATILDAVKELTSRHRVHAVGIAAAGFVDAERRNVLFAPHLSWRNEPLRDNLYRKLRLPVVVENDANAAAWGEWCFGAGRGESHLLVVNLGTGIGGATVINGSVQRGRFGIAGEFGHMQVVVGGHRCECGNRGCWEQYASGNALVREARAMADSGSPMARDLLARANGDAAAITGPLVTQLAAEGDEACMELFSEIGQWLGVGLANLVAAYDPGRIVIGGGVSDAGDLLLNPARQAFRRSLTGRGYRPEAQIVRAELGNEAGIVGAADLARPFARRLFSARYRRELLREAARDRREA